MVNATGAGAAPVAGMVRRELPLDVFPGLLVQVAAPGEPLGHLLYTPRINLRPDGPGYVLLHHDSIDERLTDDFAGAEDPLCAELLQRARRVLPALEEAEVVEARFGMRPVPADGHSCVGAGSRIPGYYEAVTHSGVTLGPLVGRLLAHEILTGEVDSLIAPFRPDRLRNPNLALPPVSNLCNVTRIAAGSSYRAWRRRGQRGETFWSTARARPIGEAEYRPMGTLSFSAFHHGQIFVQPLKT